MATLSSVKKLAGLVGVMVWLAMMIGEAEAAMSCDTVVNDLLPCYGYVTGAGPLDRRCCNGVNQLYNAAQTTQDRRSVCQCLKSLINGATYNPNTVILAAGLPDKCGVHLPFKISPSTNCNTVP